MRGGLALHIFNMATEEPLELNVGKKHIRWPLGSSGLTALIIHFLSSSVASLMVRVCMDHYTQKTVYFLTVGGVCWGAVSNKDL